MNCLERYIWAWKNMIWKNMPFITTRIVFLKTLFQSCHLLLRQMEKKLQPKAVATSLRDSNIWGHVGPDSGLQLAHGISIVSAGANSVPLFSESVATTISIMMPGERFCSYLVDETGFFFYWWFSLDLFNHHVPFQMRGKKKMLVCPCLHPCHKKICCWTPSEIIWCHSQSTCSSL